MNCKTEIRCRLKVHNKFYYISNRPKNNYVYMKKIRLRAFNKLENLIFISILDAYYYFLKNKSLYIDYETFQTNVYTVKNNPLKTYLGYKWKEKIIVKRIRIQG